MRGTPRSLGKQRLLSPALLAALRKHCPQLHRLCLTETDLRHVPYESIPSSVTTLELNLCDIPDASTLVYHIPSTGNSLNLPWKVLHGSLALGTFILVVLGLVVMFHSHDSHGMPNMYSLHSWLGLGITLLFSCRVGATLAFPNPPALRVFHPHHLFP
ncbi:hypothetical protein BTVI_127601 [Pitangus sulphuratus]|nr:hypothetical protein BTVI_127601 [Pitangus sulphuratus]